jgi:signal recognition particle subunit SRP14
LAASEGVEKEKVKLSTVVERDAISRFYERYAEVCKAGMAGGLKRRDRSGRKKARGKKVKKVG